MTVAKDAAVLAITASGAATNSALGVLRAAADLGGATVEAPVHVGEKTLGAVLDEAQTLHDKLIAVLNSAAQMIP